MGNMRFKISVDSEIPFQEVTLITDFLFKQGWKISLADNGNIICEKLEVFELKQEKT